MHNFSARLHGAWIALRAATGMRSATIALSLLLSTAHAAAGGHDTARPFVLGVTRYFRSAILEQMRTLNIYLPPGYNDSSDTAHYPVIYLLDGGADEDFIHIAGLVQYSSLPWIGRVPPSIVVGIANADRMHDFTAPTTVAADQAQYKTSGGSAAFISFIQAELQPFIARSYRTNGVRTIIGESLGGLLATEILLNAPRSFSTYIIVSPSLWWDGGSTLRNISTAAARMDSPTVYIAVGKEGPAPGALPRVMEDDARSLAEALKRRKSGRIFFDYLPHETHATIGHQAVLNAFKVVYGKR